MCLSCAAASSCDVGRSLTPPLPPLKLTRVTFLLLLITVVL